MTAIVKQILQEYKLSPNFASAMTWRINQLHEATESGAEWEQLQAIHWATDLNNYGFM